jgi:hypothetical protein
LIMAYTGPIPPTPTATSTDAQWNSWWNYQTVLTNGRYDDERAARYIVTDKQHAEKMAAEAACAASNQALATAQQAVAAAQQAGAAVLSQPTPQRLPTRAELVFDLVKIHPQATILTNAVLVDGCRGIVDAYVAKFPGAVQSAAQP